VINPLFLLDSNICIYLLEGVAPLARARIETCRPGEIVTSAIAYAEVIRGAPRDGPDGAERVDSLFSVVPVLPFDGAAAAHYARLPFKRGTFDRLIGAHALALGLTLVTNNKRDYSDIPGLRIENWMLP
jgi:tRNA(fMet)-specific endonuclease VapC